MLNNCTTVIATQWNIMHVIVLVIEIQLNPFNKIILTLFLKLIINKLQNFKKYE